MLRAPRLDSLIGSPRRWLTNRQPKPGRVQREVSIIVHGFPAGVIVSSLRIVSVFPTFVSGSCALLVVLAAVGLELSAADVKECFLPLKGTPENRHGLTMIGPDAEQCVTFEPGGVRLTLPAGYEGAR